MGESIFEKFTTSFRSPFFEFQKRMKFVQNATEKQFTLFEPPLSTLREKPRGKETEVRRNLSEFDLMGNVLASIGERGDKKLTPRASWEILQFLIPAAILVGIVMFFGAALVSWVFGLWSLLFSPDHSVGVFLFSAFVAWAFIVIVFRLLQSLFG